MYEGTPWLSTNKRENAQSVYWWKPKYLFFPVVTQITKYKLQHISIWIICWLLLSAYLIIRSWILYLETLLWTELTMIVRLKCSSIKYEYLKNTNKIPWLYFIIIIILSKFLLTFLIILFLKMFVNKKQLCVIFIG